MRDPVAGYIIKNITSCENHLAYKYQIPVENNFKIGHKEIFFLAFRREDSELILSPSIF